jgi:cysteine-rich repeat protein
MGEVCDDGVNDDSYGSCTFDCMAFGPNCGDGQVNGPEQCDDANDDAADGCISTCVVPNSCLTIHNSDDQLPSGTYQIVPDNYNGGPFAVHCDMVSDGGGYTFLKITDGQQRSAADAENTCNGWGMNLWIPRSLAHKDSGWAIANNAQVAPDASPDYMRILGIYPDFNGAGCANQPMNSSNNNCGWGASDGQAWYVHEVNNISEPNGDNNTTGSMYYQWNNDGSIQWHNDIGGDGYMSNRWMCDIGDKLP